jgi:hypothetical protein
VDRAAVGSQLREKPFRYSFHSFLQRWKNSNGRADLVECTVMTHYENGSVDEICSIWTSNVTPEDVTR